MSNPTLPSTAEYGSALFTDNQSEEITLATKPRAMLCGKPREVRLYHRTAGYVPAGSCARLQASEVWGYRWHDGRAFHGRMFKTLPEAQTAFDAIA